MRGSNCIMTQKRKFLNLKYILSLTYFFISFQGEVRYPHYPRVSNLQSLRCEASILVMFFYVLTLL